MRSASDRPVRTPDRGPSRAGAAAGVTVGVLLAHLGVAWSLAGEPARRLSAMPRSATAIELVSRPHVEDRAVPETPPAPTTPAPAPASLRGPMPAERPAAIAAAAAALRPVALRARGTSGVATESVSPGLARPQAWVVPAAGEGGPSTAAGDREGPTAGSADAALSPLAGAGPMSAGMSAAMTVAAAATSQPAAGPSDAMPPPVYPTAPPASMRLRYEMTRGFLTGEAELRWQTDGRRYDAVFDGTVLGVSLVGWHSSGGFDRAGLAPERFLDERRGRAAQAANFRRDRGVIGFSGPSIEIPLVPGAQDRLSWMIQLAAVANARKTPLAVGDRLEFFVSGARGDGDVWSFSVEGRERISLPAGEVEAIRLLREPRKPHDTRVDAWIDPARQFMPVRARLAQEGKDDALDLRLKSTAAP